MLTMTKDKTDLVKHYLCNKFKMGAYDPVALVTVWPFGDISRETISFLQEKGVLTTNLLPAHRITLRSSVAIDKPTPQEEGFYRVYGLARDEMAKTFGYCVPEDVLSFMRTKQKVQRHVRLDFGQMYSFLEERKAKGELLTKQEVLDIWADINPRAIVERYQQIT